MYFWQFSTFSQQKIFFHLQWNLTNSFVIIRAMYSKALVCMCVMFMHNLCIIKRKMAKNERFYTMGIWYTIDQGAFLRIITGMEINYMESMSLYVNRDKTKKWGHLFHDYAQKSSIVHSLSVVYTSTFCAPFSGRKTESLIQFWNWNFRIYFWFFKNTDI